MKLGFPGEESEWRSDNIIYRWRPCPGVAIYVWKNMAGSFATNIYRDPTPVLDYLTHWDARYAPGQEPIQCVDALELQLAINHLIQTHLPTEVTVNEEA